MSKLKCCYDATYKFSDADKNHFTLLIKKLIISNHLMVLEQTPSKIMQTCLFYIINSLSGNATNCGLHSLVTQPTADNWNICIFEWNNLLFSANLHSTYCDKMPESCKSGTRGDIQHNNSRTVVGVGPPPQSSQRTCSYQWWLRDLCGGKHLNLWFIFQCGPLLDSKCDYI
jgi:hypothetical protein